MSTRFGLSSGSVAALSSPDLARLVTGYGGEVVDLRAERGHAWESDGTGPFLAGGVAVAFIGLSVVLGDPRSDPQQVAQSAAGWAGLPVKVFAASALTSGDSGLIDDQVAALTVDRAPEHVLIETHHGRATPGELRQLHDRRGLSVVLDTAGFAAITAEPEVDLRTLACAVTAVQVKGFTPNSSGRPDHRPLSAADRMPLAALLAALVPASRGRLDITIESRAGTPGDDLQHVRAAWAQALAREAS